MKNQIYYLTKEAAEKKIRELNKDKNCFVGVIDGRKARTWNDYESQVSAVFQFPKLDCLVYENIEGYIDWMEDLEWLDKGAYAMFVFHHKQLITEDKKYTQDIVIGCFENILSFWEDEVEKCVCDGKKKPFNIYLVE